MLETQCQQLLVHAVVSAGGQAIKFNNRFLIGVCDLLLKLPKCQPMMLEAKLQNLSARTVNHVWDVGCTKKQQDFLRDWHDAGMLTGVVSFVQTPGREPLRTLRMAVYHYESLAFGDTWHVAQTAHKPLGGKDERTPNILQQLTEFANG